MTLPKRQADVSVAIATRDRPEMLDRCLESLLALSVLPRQIVITDQSRDEQTSTIVRKHQTGLVELVYQRQSSQGLGVAQNLAIAQAIAEIVAITDDDCVPAANWLAAVEAACAGPNGVDMVTGPVLPYGPERPDTFPVSSRTSNTRVEFHGRAMPWEIGSGNNFAVKRVWLERIGGNDERLGPGSPGQGGVDMDLFYRLARAGARIRYEPEVLVYHERASRESRLARRGPYGYGMGACCSLWLRQGDRNALRVLARWVLMRGQRLAVGLLQRDGLRAYEECLVLAGTVGGLLYGWRIGRRIRSARPVDRSNQSPVSQ